MTINPTRVALYSLAFLATLGYGIMIPSLAVHAHDLGASHSSIGFIISAYAAVQMLTQIPIGRLSDRVGRVQLVVGGFALMALAATLYNFADVPSQFIFLQAIAGVGAGCLWPPLLAMLTENTPAEERGRVMGTFNTVFFLGVGMGPLIGGVIATAFGKSAVFNIWGVVALLGAVVCVIMIKDAGRKGQMVKPAADVPMIKPGYMTTFVAGLVIRSRGGVCSSFNNALLPLYAVAMFNATPAMIGGVMFIHGLGLALFNYPGGILTDKVGRRLPALAGSMVATAGVIWYCAADSFWPLFIAVGLAGAGSAFSTPAVAALAADICDPRRRGEAFGYFLTSFNLGMVLGAFVFGLVSDALGLWGAVLAWGLTSLALSSFALLIREPNEQSVPNLVAQKA